MAPASLLTAASKAVLLLRAKIKKDEITAEHNPKSVWLSIPTFMSHKLDIFRTRFNEIKSEELSDDDFKPDDFLEHTKCSRDPPFKKAKISETTSSGYDGILLGTTQDDACKNCSNKYFQPLHTFSEWFDPGTTIKCLTVAVLLPSGVGPGAFSVLVVYRGLELHATVTWINPLTDYHMSHRKWLTSMGNDKLEIHHPKCIGFEDFLESFLVCSTDSIESTAKIRIPFEVQTHIFGKYKLGWRDSNARVIYI